MICAVVVVELVILALLVWLIVSDFCDRRSIRNARNAQVTAMEKAAADAIAWQHKLYEESRSTTATERTP